MAEPYDVDKAAEEFSKHMEGTEKMRQDALKEISRAFDPPAHLQKQLDELKNVGANLNFPKVYDPVANFRMPVPPPNPNWTSEIFKHVKNWIEQFQSKLDPEHEVGARLVNFGQTIQFYLESIEYCASPLMLFKGTMEDGTPVELIQHVSQISILLVRMPKQNPEAPKRVIGFHEDGA